MARTQRVTFLKVTLKDQPGTVLGLMQNLKGKNVSLKSLWGVGGTDVYAVAKDTEKLQDVLNALGLQSEKGSAFFMKGTDKVGVLLKSLEALSNAGVNMKGIYAIAVSGKYGSLIWVDTADVEKAAEALGAK